MVKVKKPEVNELAAFFRTGKKKTFSAGEVILRGDEPEGVVFIDEGFVTVYSISDTGDRYVHIIYKHGEIVPLIWAFKNTKRLVFYEAASNVIVWQKGRSDFLAFLKQNNQASYTLLGQFAEQFNVYADRLDNLEYKTARQRIVFRLLFLAGRFGERRDEKIIIQAPITHELIAASINLTRETVSRELEKLEKEGMLSRLNGRIIINNAKKLSGEFSKPMSLDFWGLQKD